VIIAYAVKSPLIPFIIAVIIGIILTIGWSQGVIQKAFRDTVNSEGPSVVQLVPDPVPDPVLDPGAPLLIAA
jgi:hypothetical protein